MDAIQITGIVADKAVKETKGGTQYIELKIQSDEGSEYATTVRAFDNDIVAQCISDIRKEDSVTLGIEERIGQYQGKDVTYRNIISIVEVNGSGARVGTSPTVSRSSVPQSTPKPKLVQQVGGTAQIDPNQMRIMRQSTLGYACVLHAPLVKDFATPELMMARTIQLAGKLLEYVITGDMPLSEEGEQAEPEPQPEDDDIQSVQVI